MKVFLVEDSELLRSRLTALLSAIPGAQVIGHAEDAGEAVRAIREARPDAVVLDLHLRNSNGLDVLRALGELAQETAFFVLTNYPVEGFRNSAMRLGARGFFDKSHEINLLRDAVAQLARGPQPAPK